MGNHGAEDKPQIIEEEPRTVIIDTTDKNKKVPHPTFTVDHNNKIVMIDTTGGSTQTVRIDTTGKPAGNHPPKRKTKHRLRKKRKSKKKKKKTTTSNPM